MNGNASSRKRYKPLAYLLALGFVVFANCFGFPIYNLNKEWPLSLTAVMIFVPVSCAFAAGGFLAELFPAKSSLFILALTAALTFAGWGCRFLLEFGEVSNTYNFTPANMLLHFVVFVGVAFWNWHSCVKRKQGEG